MHIAEELQRDVEGLAGKRYMRDGISGYDRWGEQEGSVYLLPQRNSLSNLAFCRGVF